MQVQPICQDCKFIAAQGAHDSLVPVCTLFQIRLTGEPINCQGKMPREQQDDNTTDTRQS